MTDIEIKQELQRLEARKQELLRVCRLRSEVLHLEKLQALDTRAQTVLDLVAQEYGVSVKEMLSRRRTERVVWPRMVCYTLLYELLGFSSQEVATICGRKDHGSVLSGRETVREWGAISPKMYRRVAALTDRCRQDLGLEQKEAA